MNMSDDNQTEEVAVEEPVVDEAIETTVESNPNNLNVNDLNTMASVIEAVSQRGAVRAGEMQVVGTLYTKLHAFLVANGVRQVPGVAAEPTQETTEETQEESTDA
jgi:hypothetical protein